MRPAYFHIWDRCVPQKFPVSIIKLENLKIVYNKLITAIIIITNFLKFLKIGYELIKKKHFKYFTSFHDCYVNETNKRINKTTKNSNLK